MNESARAFLFGRTHLDVGALCVRIELKRRHNPLMCLHRPTTGCRLSEERRAESGSSLIKPPLGYVDGGEWVTSPAEILTPW